MTQQVVRVVSYNISFAAALEIEEGSERHFVRKFCDGLGSCRHNAMDSVAKVTPDVLCLQEYRPWDNVKEAMLGDAFATVQFDIKGSDSVSNKLKMQTLFGPSKEVKGSWVAMHGRSFYEGIATIWNAGVMGNMQCQTSIDLADNAAQGVRPCLITMFSKGALVINCHAPQPEDYTIESFTEKVNKAVTSMRSTNTFQIATIVLCGDFNDRRGKKFGNGVTIADIKINAPAKIISCCYEPGYGSDDDGVYNFKAITL